MRPSDPIATWRGISDERRIFETFTSVLRQPGFRDGAPERHPWFRDGASARARARTSGEPVVIVRGAVGMLGYAAGPEVIVIDEFALGDPLLASLPVATPWRWRIGHFQRAVPEGYLRARATGDTSGMQPDLARYWEQLRLVVSGPLFAPERLLAIARLNLGAGDGRPRRVPAQPRPAAGRLTRHVEPARAAECAARAAARARPGSARCSASLPRWRPPSCSGGRPSTCLSSTTMTRSSSS